MMKKFNSIFSLPKLRYRKTDHEKYELKKKKENKKEGKCELGKRCQKSLLMVTVLIR